MRRSSAPLRFPSKKHSSLLVLWHLLSLDAATVAALWTWFIARANGVVLTFTPVAAMFVAVWLLYAGDRLLDSRADLSQALQAAPQLEARHRFHSRHRRGFTLGIVAAACLLAMLLPQLPPASIRLYLIEGSFLAGYFLLIHAVRSSPRLPKEIAVGLFFAAATFIPTISRQPALRLRLLLPAVLFAALCSLNCLWIYAWEHPSDLLPGTPACRSSAHRTTQLALRQLPKLSAMITVAATALACSGNIPAVMGTAIALAVVLLFTLDLYRDRLPATTVRAAADLALLTPALLLAFT